MVSTDLGIIVFVLFIEIRAVLGQGVDQIAGDLDGLRTG
jgi:hypothetical protein